jgi:DUF4097 and DUF4098 domain-containing protein YvlB
MRPILILVPALLLGATALEAQKKEEAFDWKGAIAAGRTLAIRDVNGNIRVTQASGGEAVVHAVKRARKGDVSSVQVKVEQDADGITICALWTTDASATCSSKSKHGHDDSDDGDEVNVDFTVQVPAGVRFEGSTVNGGIDAQGLTADAEVATVNGDIGLATAGVASATTVNGSVKLRLGKASWTGSLDARTVNGSVVVEMPAPADLDVTAGTLNGSVSSDFPLTLSGKMSPQKLHGTIGKGGPKLRLESVNGDVSLRRVG